MILKQKKKTDTLILQREVYCLLHPRKEIVEIGSKCEKKLKNMTKKDFLRKGCFKKLHLQLTISFFPENVTFFNDMNCGHKNNIVSIIVKCFLNL